jgi:hypothetical protein
MKSKTRKDNMKTQFTYTVAILLATIAVANAGPNDDAIIAKEKAIWQAFKDKKADEFQKLVSADVVAVYPDGIKNMKNELDSMSKTTTKSFSLSDFKVVMPDADTAMISYKAKVESSMEGKSESGNYNCGSVWRMKNGEWHAIFHSDMKEEKAAK